MTIYKKSKQVALFTVYLSLTLGVPPMCRSLKGRESLVYKVDLHTMYQIAFLTAIINKKLTRGSISVNKINSSFYNQNTVKTS